MKIKNFKIYGLEESIIRSGYPMQTREPNNLYDDEGHVIGEEGSNKDYTRAKKLAKVPPGSGHDNFLKGIIVQFDLQYPEYFSPQLQRYHWIDIISSQSKMHKIASRELTKDDFTEGTWMGAIDHVNMLIKIYNTPKVTKEQKEQVFKEIIGTLPSGYLKWMGISTNYLQLKTIYNQRKSHKLEEWKYFCKWIESLPYSKDLILIEK